MLEDVVIIYFAMVGNHQVKGHHARGGIDECLLLGFSNCGRDIADNTHTTQYLKYHYKAIVITVEE